MGEPVMHPELRARGKELLERLSAVQESYLTPNEFLHVGVDDPAAPIASDGTATDVVMAQRTAEQLCFELSRGTKHSDHELLERLRALAEEHARKGQVPLVVCHLRYHSAHELFRKLMQTDFAGGESFVVPDAPTLRKALDERRAFFACPPLPTTYDDFVRRPDVHRGLDVAFVLSADGFSNVKEPLSGVTVDFDDGSGARPLQEGHVAHVVYPTPGVKTLKLVARCGEDTLHTQFEFVVREAVAPPKPDAIWTGLEHRVELRGFSAQAPGTAYVLLGRGNTRLRQPVIVCDGFPGHTYTEIWDTIDAEGFATSILDAGRDLIFVSYEDGKALVEANAGVVIACIQRALKERLGDQPLVVGGASMGGMVSRFALAYMEHRRMPEVKQVAGYFSFDTPHQGANIPLCLQFALFALAPYKSEAAMLKERLESKAAQELILYYVNEKGVFDGGASPLRAQLERHLAEIGQFPTTPQRIAVANGDGSGDSNYTANDARVFLIEQIGGRVDLYSARGLLIEVESSRLYCSVTYGFDMFEGKTTRTSPPPHIDSAPGGTSDFFAQFEVAAGGGMAFSRSACFVPTISALAMPLDVGKDEDLKRDLRHNPPPTPFTAYKFAQLNTPHVAITAELRDWLLEQLGVPVPIGEGLVDVIATDVPNRHRAEAFAVTESGRVYHSEFDGDAAGHYAWSPWSNSSPGLTGAPRARSAVVIPNNVNQNTEAFLIGTDNTLYHNYYTGAWRGWSNLEGSSLQFPEEAGRLSAAPNAKANRLQLCMITTSRLLFLNHFEASGDDGAWGKWEQQIGGVAHAILAPNPRNGNVELLGISTAGALVHGYFDGTKLRQVRIAQEGLAFSGKVRQLFAVSNRGVNNLEVFLVSDDGRLHHNYYDGQWRGWTDQRAPRFPNERVVSVFGAENPIDGGVVMFAVTDEGQLYESYYEAKQWHPWRPDRPGLELPARVTGGVAMANHAKQLRVDAFVLGASPRNLYRNHHQLGATPHWWSGWTYSNVSGGTPSAR